MICALFSMSLFSAPLLQIGANASYNAPIADDAFSDGLKEIENYTFGVEARVNLFDWVSFAVPATFGGFGGEGILVSTLPSVNLNIPAAEFLDIALGLGMRMDFLHSGDSWYINGTSMDDAGNALMEARLAYRAALTFNLFTYFQPVRLWSRSYSRSSREGFFQFIQSVSTVGCSYYFCVSADKLFLTGSSLMNILSHAESF